MSRAVPRKVAMETVNEEWGSFAPRLDRKILYFTKLCPLFLVMLIFLGANRVSLGNGSLSRFCDRPYRGTRVSHKRKARNLSLRKRSKRIHLFQRNCRCCGLVQIEEGMALGTNSLSRLTRPIHSIGHQNNAISEEYQKNINDTCII